MLTKTVVAATAILAMVAMQYNPRISVIIAFWGLIGAVVMGLKEYGENGE